MPPKTSFDVSVIVPFYNEVAFINTTIDSILSQEIDRIEVIIVNDNPAVFKDEYFESLGLPDCVKVIHHDKNRGLPSSRNTGIDAAQGAYIGFVDADDYYLPEGLVKQYKSARKTGADMVHGQAVITFINKSKGQVLRSDARHLGRKARGVYEKADVLQAGFAIESSWSSLYRADFLREKSVRFDPTQVKFEDRLFVIEALTACDRLTILGEPVRAWRKRNSSITTSAKSFQECKLKMALLEKCVARWKSSGSAEAHYWAVRETVRQVNFMITKNPTSPWFTAFGFSDDQDSLTITKMISDFLRSLELTEHDILTAFDAQEPRYADAHSGNDLITPQDLFTFINAVAHNDLKRARDIIEVVVDRPRDQEPLPTLPAVVEGEQVDIYFHFGLHKTGTTHIQHQLAANRDVLRQHGILFPKTGLGFPEGVQSVRAQGLPGHQALVTAVFKNDKSLLDQLIGEIRGSGCKTVIISAENLSQPDASVERRAKRVRRLVEAMRNIGTVKPVIMYRRPDAWLESYYRELTGNGSEYAYQTPSEFVVNNKAVLDFGGIVKSIEMATSQTARLMSFEDALTSHDDLLFAFLDLCGAEVPQDALSIVEGVRYASTCNAQMHIARLVALMVPDIDTRKNILRTFYALNAPTDQTSKLFTKPERAEIIDAFCDSAQDLFEQRGIGDLRAAWKAEANKAPAPKDPAIPFKYIETLGSSMLFNSALANLKSKDDVEDFEFARPPHIAEVSRSDLDRMGHDLHRLSEDVTHMGGELNYMKNSVSWRVTKPLRSVMTLYRTLRKR